MVGHIKGGMMLKMILVGLVVALGVYLIWFHDISTKWTKGADATFRESFGTYVDELTESVETSLLRDAVRACRRAAPRA